MYRSLVESYKQFVEGCQWRQGVKHPTIAHVHSGYSKDTWEADAGWTFVNPGTSDLSVKRIPIAQDCSRCRGHGFLQHRVTCPVCHGRRYVPNPVAGVGRAIGTGLGAWGRGWQRQLPNIPMGPAQLPCSNCGAQGVVFQPTQCESCGGKGTISR